MAGLGSGWPKSERALLCMKYFLFAFNVISFVSIITNLKLNFKSGIQNSIRNCSFIKLYGDGYYFPSSFCGNFQIDS